MPRRPKPAPEPVFPGRHWELWNGDQCPACGKTIVCPTAPRVLNSPRTRGGGGNQYRTKRSKDLRWGD
jgi:hypothetical protein